MNTHDKKFHAPTNPTPLMRFTGLEALSIISKNKARMALVFGLQVA
jgi:hypothetical protein